MRKSHSVVTMLLSAALCSPSVPAALYWDGNGTAGAAPPTPNGTWGTSAFWNSTADGTTTPPGDWVAGEDAVFSAGSDAAGAFTVTLNGTQTAGNLTVEEGMIHFSGGPALDLGGGMAGKGLLEVAAGLTATMNTVLAGGDDTGQITKTGGGLLILNSPCTSAGGLTIAGGSVKLGAANLLNPHASLSIAPTCVLDMNHTDQTVDGLFGVGAILNAATLRVGHDHHPAATFYGSIGDYFDYSPTTLIKLGTGTQTLAGPGYYTGLTIVSDGVLAVSDGDALGLTDSSTIISNGAALHLTGASGYGEPVVLHGQGPANQGALRGGPATTTWIGGALLGDHARINSGGGTWTWSVKIVDGTAGNFNLAIGGDGGNIRFNVANQSPSRAIDLGIGTLTKDGSSQLQLEVPSKCSAFFFNGGHVYPRYPGFGQGNIYVGAGAGEFRALFASPEVPQPMILAPGANPLFNCNQMLAYPFTAFHFTCNGVISGAGGLSKTNGGTLFLNNANTYTGNTTVQWAALALGVNGSISNSAVIDLWSNATFDVTAKGGGFVLQPGQLLQGNGTVLGNVTALGAMAPGASIGALTFLGDLTLQGNLSVDVNKSSAPSNDTFAVSGALTNVGGGVLTVANLDSESLAIGDVFQLFTDEYGIPRPLHNGQAMTVTGGGVIWSNHLSVDGSISVASVLVKVPASQLTLQITGPTSRQVSGVGAANSPYDVYATTNVTLPMTDWWRIGTIQSGTGGEIHYLDAQATNAIRFYRFGQ